MRFYNKKQNIFLTFFLVLEFFVTNVFPASALFGGPSIPSASSIMSDMEQRYHLDPAALQNLGEGMNVTGNKGSAPEVSLSFSPSDPKPGEKLSAKAFPMYFSNPEASMYYTWYLKRKDCDLTNNPTDANKTLCDRDDDGEITVEDWKIEATKILVQSGYDNGDADYSKDDDDGYRAKYGGDNKTNVENRCYANDASTGTNYEFVRNLPDKESSGCSSGTPVCAVEEQGTDPGTTVDGSGSTFTSGGNGKFHISGYPSCSSSSLTCSVGTAYCTSTLTNIITGSLSLPNSTCEVKSLKAADPYCFHLFPLSYKESAKGDVSINRSGGSYLKVGETGGQFGANEERFWGTNPNDPSTADNGNKDEANVVGLGQSTFTWNYDSGDQVGVAVEGTSMFPTKFGDSSYMIMWAFPKKNCPVLELADQGGYYVYDIKGYQVKIDAVKGFDLNKCIAYIKILKDGKEEIHNMNLVDPTEGGQATKLSVSVTASPENPVNDSSSDKSGDTIIARATVDNAAQSIANILFDWRVYIGSTISSFNSTTTSKDITSELRTSGLLGNIKGNALDSISLKLDIPTDKSPYKGYLDSNNMGYLKFQSTATENFSDGIARKGKSDVIVKFVSSTDSISAYTVLPVPSAVPRDTMRVQLDDPSGKICDNVLDRTVCRVIKNEIIGLKVDGIGLSNFNWTINGSPLACTARVSNDCSLYGEKKAASPPQSTTDDDKKIDAVAQGPINYFPVSGNVGDTYTVTMTANDIASGKTVTLTRSFNVVEPKVVIKSVDKTLAWPKFLGQYKDISGSSTCQGSPGYCDDLSESIYQTYSGSNLGFYADFIPDVISGVTTQEWTVDDIAYTPTFWSASTVTPKEKMISINSADKQAGGVYTINLLAQVVQSEDIRKALLDIWGISPFDSPEINFASSIQVEVQEVLTTEGPLSGPRKYYAAIASYIPASILFTFRIFLSVALTLFVLSLLNSLLEERRLEAFVRSFSRSRDKED